MTAETWNPSTDDADGVVAAADECTTREAADDPQLVARRNRPAAEFLVRRRRAYDRVDREYNETRERLQGALNEHGEQRAEQIRQRAQLKRKINAISPVQIEAWAHQQE